MIIIIIIITNIVIIFLTDRKYRAYEIREKYQICKNGT